VDNAVERNCSAFQIFTRNPRGWHAKDLTKEEKWVYWHWVRDNYAKFDRINGDLHPYIQSECVKINIQHLRNTAKNNSAL